MFGNPETTTGGRALKFYSSVRIDIRRIGQIKEGDQDIGSRTRVKVVKNKMAPPFKLAEFDILYGSGISRTGDLIDLAITHRLIDKSGAWFSYGETRLGQGRENVRQLLEQNADLRQEIDQKLRRQLGLIKEKKGDDKKADGDAKKADGDDKAAAAEPTSKVAEAPSRAAEPARPVPPREPARPGRPPSARA
jgi:recombination protein RecA